MLTKRTFLILANKSKLLYCMALAEALIRKEVVDVDVVEDLSHEIATGQGAVRYDLALCVEASAVFKLHRLRHTGTKLLLVLDARERLALRLLLALGVDGAITSEATYAELLLAIDTLVMRKLKYISPFIAAGLTENPGPDGWASLSPKERYISLGVTEGKRDVDMAADLNISHKTVSTYKSRIYRKLGVSNDMELLKVTIGRTLVDRE